MLREVRADARAARPIAVRGARGLVPLLARDLSRDGDQGAVREDGAVEGAAALVYLLAGEPTDGDLAELCAANRAKVPIVCVADGSQEGAIPYVLATDVVAVPPGAGFPVEEIARALARRLGERATPLAARLPVLRPAVCDELIRKFSRRNAVLGAAVFVPGADLPVLTLNQIRLALRIADAYGRPADRERLPELLGVVGGALGFRALAREAVGLVPVAGWAVKGGIAWAGTRAVGEAAVRWFESRA